MVFILLLFLNTTFENSFGIMVFILLLFLNTTFENSFGYSRKPGRTKIETSLGKQDKN